MNEGTTPASGHVRLRVDLVVEIADAEALTKAALQHVEHDDSLPDGERAHARETVAADSGEAIAHLVDPFVLAGQLPGVELAHASWGCEQLAPGEPADLDDLDDVDEFDDAAEFDDTAELDEEPADSGSDADGKGGHGHRRKQQEHEQQEEEQQEQEHRHEHKYEYVEDYFEDDEGDWLGGGVGGD